MSNIRRFFVAPPGYSIVEFDYKQLEIYTLASLSKDASLIADLIDGVDIHCMSLSLMLPHNTYDEWKAQYDAGDKHTITMRKAAKRVSFLVQYGGSARTASEQTGVPKADCERYISNYYARYEDVKKFNDAVLDSVMKCRLPNRTKTASGKPAAVGYYKAPTGRLFGFTESDSYKTNPSFSPTQIKNYPTQGTGWDIVAAMLAHFMDLCYNAHPEAQFVNTVHDSLMFYVPDKEVHEFVNLGTKELSNVPSVAKKLWGWEVPLRFPVEAKAGKDWLNLTTEI